METSSSVEIGFGMPACVEVQGTAKIPIELPGFGRLNSEFASDLGQALQRAPIFLHNDQVVVPDDSGLGLSRVTPAFFAVWVEDWVVCHSLKNDVARPRSMTNAEAAKVLQAPPFLRTLRKMRRFNPVPLPLRAGESLIVPPGGYDAGSQIFTSTSGVGYELDWDLRRAVRYLDDLLSEFPFRGDHSKPAVIAAMLSLYAGGLLPDTCNIPAFLLTANDAGCGKGLCAALAVLPVLGFLPTGVLPCGEDEIQKLLFSCAKSGQKVLFIDNLNGRIQSRALESYLTASNICGRVLGESTQTSHPKQTVVLITGNNCQVGPDMRRRSIIVEFFMEELQSEHRRITHPMDEQWILGHRREILSALHGLTKAWVDGGSPKGSRVLGGFHAWSETVAGIVEHAGWTCPVPTNAPAEMDEELAEMNRLVARLHEDHRRFEWEFSKLVQYCQAHGFFGNHLKTEGAISKAERTSFSRMLSRFQGRIFPGSVRFAVRGAGHSRRYSVARLEPAAIAVELAAE